MLIAVNLLISADWVRDRVAARIKEQTGRELKVNGTTALLFTPRPHVVITEATITDPDARAGTADLAIGRLELDLAFGQLLSRQVDAEQVVLVRPVLTLRLGKDTDRAEAREDRPHVVKAAEEDKPKRDVRLKDVHIEDGTVTIVYDEKGTERRIEHIDATASLPSLDDPFTSTGKFVWKDQSVDFGIELTTLADLRAKRPARLVLSLDNPAIAARFEGDVMTKPSFSGHGDLSAKVHSIPSLLAWMRERPPAATAIGDGELASKLVWTEQEITFSEARFALEHASGLGQAVVTLQSPRPHVRAALALDHLDLNPFLAANASSGKPAKPVRTGAAPAETAAAAANRTGRGSVLQPRRAPAPGKPLRRRAPLRGRSIRVSSRSGRGRGAAAGGTRRSTRSSRGGASRLRCRRQCQCPPDPCRPSRAWSKLARSRLSRRRS